MTIESPTYRLDNNRRIVANDAFDPLDTHANLSRAVAQAYIDQHATCSCGVGMSRRQLFVESISNTGKVTLVCWMCDAIRRGVIKHEYLNP